MIYALIEVCYYINHLIGLQSTFSIYHDESTINATSFLQTLLSFTPDYNNEDIFVPELLNDCVSKPICSQDSSDKTAQPAVHESILPAIHIIKEKGCRL